MGKRGLFRPAKHRKISKIVSFKNPTQARKSAKKLVKAFKSAKTRKQKRTIKQATVCASNRAKVIANKKKNLSAKERKQFREISKIYKEAYEKMEL